MQGLTTSITAKIAKRWYYSPSHRLAVNVLLKINIGFSATDYWVSSCRMNNDGDNWQSRVSRSRLIEPIHQRHYDHRKVVTWSDVTISGRKHVLRLRGVATGGISVYIPPKSVYLNFLCGCFVSLTHLYPPKSNSWLRPCLDYHYNCFLTSLQNRIQTCAGPGNRL